RSPIRGHTTGTARVTQVMLDRVVREVGETLSDSKTIIFTDSRDDAANTAAGVELNHFRDLIRQLVTDELETVVPPSVIIRRAARDEDLSESERRLVDLYKREDPDAWAAFRADARGLADAADTQAMEDFDSAHAGGGQQLDWQTLLARIESRMVDIGVNPA